MTERIWKYRKQYPATVKHLFENDKVNQPLCRTGATRNLTKWADQQERLDNLRPCIKCVNKEHQLTLPARGHTPPNPQPKKIFNEKDYVWKYMDTPSATVVHAFGLESAMPFCGRAPEEYGVFWQSDAEGVAGKSKCGLCVKYAH